LTSCHYSLLGRDGWMEVGRKAAVISRPLRDMRAYKSGRNKQCVRCGAPQVRADGKRNRLGKCKDREGDVASVSARTRHVTPTKGSFAYKCAWTELGSGQEGDRGRVKECQKNARASEDKHATRMSSVTKCLKLCCASCVGVLSYLPSTETRRSNLHRNLRLSCYPLES